MPLVYNCVVCQNIAVHELPPLVKFVPVCLVITKLSFQVLTNLFLDINILQSCINNNIPLKL